MQNRMDRRSMAKGAVALAGITVTGTIPDADANNSLFELKRRSDPSAAFAEIFESLSKAIRDNPAMAEAATSAIRNSRGVVLSQEGLVQLAKLDQRGARELGVDILGVPHAMGPGIVLMYSAAVEGLRSIDVPIRPDFIGVPEIKEFASSSDIFVPLIGGATLTALEGALRDDRFAEQLRESAHEFVAYLDNAPDFGHCTPPQCEVAVYNETTGTYTVECSDCENGGWGGILLLGLAVWGLGKVFDWW